MKRGFLCGLGFALLVIGVGVLSGGPFGELALAFHQRWFSILVGLFILLLCVLAVLAARRAPAHNSWLVTIVAWVCGYFAISLIGGGLLVVFSLIVGVPIPYISN